MARQFGVSAERVENLVRLLQRCEPAGICARNLKECLKLQLAAAGCLDRASERMVDECLELLAKNKYAAIAGRIGVTSAEAAGIAAVIRTLDPKPGSGFFRQDDARYIIPDVYVSRSSDGFTVSLNSADSPRVTVNKFYRQLQNETSDAEVKSYLDDKIRQTEWLRKCIDQRHTTIQKITGVIVRLQNAFFRQGPDYLVSMRLADVARAAELHESTVSRAIDQKYLECEYGTFPMRYFFQRRATGRSSRSVAIQDQDYTGREIKQILKDIISREDPQKPFSDRVLCEKLGEMGISVSRRTVAKYRGESDIPDASGRKAQY